MLLHEFAPACIALACMAPLVPKVGRNQQAQEWACSAGNSTTCSGTVCPCVHVVADCCAVVICGCIVVLQEMLDFCGKHGIHADVEVGVLTVRSAGLRHWCTGRMAASTCNRLDRISAPMHAGACQGATGCGLPHVIAVTLLPPLPLLPTWLLLPSTCALHLVHVLNTATPSLLLPAVLLFVTGD